MIIVVTGSRLWPHKGVIGDTLQKAKDEHGDALALIWGGARGADSIAGQWAIMNQVTQKRMDAEWERHVQGWCNCRHPEKRNYCPMAGHFRNWQMAETAKDLRDLDNEQIKVLAFKDNLDRTLKKGGTENMIGLCLNREFPVYHHNGEVWRQLVATTS